MFDKLACHSCKLNRVKGVRNQALAAPSRRAADNVHRRAGSETAVSCRSRQSPGAGDTPAVLSDPPPPAREDVLACQPVRTPATRLPLPAGRVSVPVKDAREHRVTTTFPS